MKSKKKWAKFRHKVIRNILYPFVKLFLNIKMGIKIIKFKNSDKGPYLIIYNHQTGYDQFIVSAAFKFPIYHVASDDLFSNGKVSKLMKYCFNPIPIKKNVSDFIAVKNCIKIAKEGASIVLSPEGNRTFSGETGWFNPAIASMAKILKLRILVFKIEGGYNVFPRWADELKKGKSIAYVSKIIDKQTIEALSKEELNEMLKKELYNNDFNIVGQYKGKNRAEYLERVAYVCPNCGLSEFMSQGNIVSCKKCGLSVEYSVDKTLKVVSGDFPFTNYLDWYRYQCKYVNSLDLLHQESCLFYKEKSKLYFIVPCEKKELISNDAIVELYSDKIIVVADNLRMEMLFSDISGISVLGKNKLNVYFNNKLYQFKSEKRFNAVKYLNFYHRYNNQLKEKNNEFLGI